MPPATDYPVRDGNGDIIPLSPPYEAYAASAGVSEILQARLEALLPTLKEYGAFGDGTSHPLSDEYDTTAEVEADYPGITVASLDNEKDATVLEWVLANDMAVRITRGTYLQNYAITQNSTSAIIVAEQGAVLKGSGSATFNAAMIASTTTMLNLRGLTIDGQHKFKLLLNVTNASGFISKENSYINAGVSGATVTNISAMIASSGTSITIQSIDDFFDTVRATDASDAVYGSYGSTTGGANYVAIEPSTGAYVDVLISRPKVRDTNSEAREFDMFNLNTGFTSGPGMRVLQQDLEYGPNCQRTHKLHEGNYEINGGYIRPKPGFVPAPPVGADAQSEIGVRSQECIGVAGGSTYAGNMIVRNLTLDWRGFTLGIGITGTSINNRLLVENCTLRGSNIPYSRYDYKSGANQVAANSNGIGFRDNANCRGGVVRNTTFEGGMIGPQLVGTNGAILGCTMDDQQYHAGWVNCSASNQFNIRVEGNRIITRTPGAMYSSFRCFPIQGTNADVTIRNNEFVQAGNTNHRANVFEIMTSTITGIFEGNKGPATCTPNGGASATCFIGKNNTTSNMRFGDNFWPNTDGVGNRCDLLTATSANTFAIGEIGYVSAAGTITKTDADAEATAKGKLYIATNAISGGAVGVFMEYGTLVTSGLTAGDNLYLSQTAGAYTATAPTDPGSINRIIGYALSSTRLKFNPDNTYLEN